MTFDDVLDELRRVCEQHPAWSDCQRALVIRDVRGQVRLCLQMKEHPEGDLKALASELGKRLGAFFVPPVLSSTAGGDLGRLARKLIGEAQALGFQPWGAEGTRWSRLERRLSKQEWLDGGVLDPPWPLQERTPPIVSFYSFKGGVGRTTALLSCAWQLAANGKKVAVLDLDLEAPGLGSLCLGDGQIGRGIVDYLVDHIATGDGDAESLRQPATALGADVAERLSVYPAGKLSMDYLEKLARLDFLAVETSGTGAEASEGSLCPTAQSLRHLLKQIRGSFQPDHIFLDSRAGLHDLAGLSLHGLAHLDVLCGRASRQSHEGLQLTMETLARRRSPRSHRPRYLVIHGMASRGAAQDSEERRFVDETYRIFCDSVYAEVPGVQEEARDPPPPQDPTAPHFPVVLHRNESLEYFTEVQTVREVLFSQDYRGLLRTLMERLERPAGPDAALP